MKRLYQTAASAIFATVVAFGILGVEPAAQAEDSQLPPPLQLPEPTGSYPVGTTTYDFLAPNRDEIYTPQPNDKRELVVQFWYPSEVVSGATPAPYLSEVVARTLAQQQGLPPDVLVNLVHSIQTHAIKEGFQGHARFLGE